jgi:putative DNA methylase
MNGKRKLIEVALPLSEINDASAYDKMPGIGSHPKGIHHWWARLPLPSARAILFASLVDDPSVDPAFTEKSEQEQDEERERLFGILRALLQKKIHEHPQVFERAYQEIVRCCGEQIPTVLDPFCGGGSIPLEAQRLGLPVQASDLNPVAVLITKALIEVVPRFAERPPVNPASRKGVAYSGTWTSGKGLADDVRFYGQWVLEEARKRLAHLYPRVKLPREHGGREANVIAWIWARTVQCPNHACEVITPLVRSFALSTKKASRAWIAPRLNERQKRFVYEVKAGNGSAPTGTVNKKGARCLHCPYPISFDYIKSEAKAGRLGSQLMAIVAQGQRGRVYLSPSQGHEEVAGKADLENSPDTDIPEKALGFRVQPYGFTKHRHLFTPRQLHSLDVLSDLVKEVHGHILKDASSASGWPQGNDLPLHEGGCGPRAYADAVTTFLAFAIDRLADFNCGLSRWKPSGEQQMQLFGRGAIPMVWDYAEANVLGEKAICWKNAVEITANAIETVYVMAKASGQARQLDATSALPGGSHFLISTDPPYYDNIGYADLSDFFYVWLRRTIGKLYPDICSTVLVPKAPELVATPERFENDKERAKQHFETGFRKAFTILQQKLDPRFPMTVYYAFKQADEEENGQTDDDEPTNTITLTTGWETMLEGLISTGFQITGTWPVRASQAWRMRAMGSNALASYIVLACRPRQENAPLATRREFITALKGELPAALKHLQHGNIAPVDLAQASIGPGMAVYSRFAKVLEADGSPMAVRTALQLINQELDAYLAAQESEMDRDTQFCLAWFEQYGMEAASFGEADVLARAKNTSVQGLVDAGVVHSRAGRVRLLKRDEYLDDWNPVRDARLTVWECTQHLIRALNTGGEHAAAKLVKQLGGGRSEESRALAYRLFAICERKKWADEALAYNSLVVSWPAIQEKAATLTQHGEQEGLYR